MRLTQLHTASQTSPTVQEHLAESYVELVPGGPKGSTKASELAEKVKLFLT